MRTSATLLALLLFLASTILPSLAESGLPSPGTGNASDSSNCYGEKCCPGQAISTNRDVDDDDNMICCVGNKKGGIDLTETTCTAGVAVPMTADDYDKKVAEITASQKSAAKGSKSVSPAAVTTRSSGGIGAMITPAPAWAGVAFAAGGILAAI